MATALARGHVVNKLAIFQADIRAALFGSATPAADADDFVVFGPCGESIICCMNRNKAATIFYIFNQIILSVLGPILAVVITYYNLIVGKFRSEGCNFGALWGAVATSTLNLPVSSRIFLRIGVVPFQLWLFWPSRINALIFSSAKELLAINSARVMDSNRTANLFIINLLENSPEK